MNWKRVEMAHEPLTDLAAAPGNGKCERAKDNQRQEQREKERHKLRHSCLQRPLEGPDDGHGEKRKGNRRENRAGQVQRRGCKNDRAEREHAAHGAASCHVLGNRNTTPKRLAFLRIDHNPVSTSVYTCSDLRVAARFTSPCKRERERT
jgi:hypothetical protein